MTSTFIVYGIRPMIVIQNLVKVISRIGRPRAFYALMRVLLTRVIAEGQWQGGRCILLLVPMQFCRGLHGVAALRDVSDVEYDSRCEYRVKGAADPVGIVSRTFLKGKREYLRGQHEYKVFLKQTV